MRNANWLGKAGQKIPSLISCYSDFHVEQLREMETRGYLHVLAYWECTKRLHYIQECCLVCKPGNPFLLAHPAAQLERGRAVLSTRDLWKRNSGKHHVLRSHQTSLLHAFLKPINGTALCNGNPTAIERGRWVTPSCAFENYLSEEGI